VFDTNEDGQLTKNEVIRILKLNSTHAVGKSETEIVIKAEELLKRCGNGLCVTIDAVLANKEQSLNLWTPIYERVEKISRLASTVI
jgi:hypothetical protein